MSRPSIKSEAQYEALREQGYSQQRVARISNTPKAGKKGGKTSNYPERTKEELYQKAKDVGIEGRSRMIKEELIKALRNN